MKICDIVGKKLIEREVSPDHSRPAARTSVGIEVELEGVSPATGLNWWSCVNDGSLNNGIEYVSEPVWGTSISDALDEMSAVLAEDPPYLSFRTSIHIHVNVLDLNPRELEHFIKLSVFYEPALFRLHNDWDRYENIFCVPAKKSTLVQRGYGSLLHDIRHECVRGDYVASKYAALNPNSVATFGTLEFRHMGGSADMSRVSEWINLLLQLKVSAQEKIPFDQPKKVFGKYFSQLTLKPEDTEDGWNMLEFIDLRG